MKSFLNYIKRYKIAILIFINSIWIGFSLLTYILVHFDLHKDSPDPLALQYISIFTLIFVILCTFYCGIKKATFFKKYLLELLLWLGVVFFIFVIVMFYLISDGFRDYKRYCSHFIPLVDSYYLQNHKYPDSLSVVDDKLIYNIRYSPKRCGYRYNKDSYYFYFGEGMTAYGYDSITKKWWQD